MVYGAIDLHKRYSQVRVLDGEGGVLRETKVETTPARLVAACGGLGPIRVLLESGTESEWVAQALEAAGYAVIVADPNYAPMYGDLRRRVKTDRRDVAALAEANRRGWFRPAYRRSTAQRQVQQILLTRRQLVRMRAGAISSVRTLLRQAGLRVGAGSSATIPRRVAQVSVPPALQPLVEVLTRTITQLTTEMAGLEDRLAALAAADPVVQRLTTVPGVGPVVALTFRAYLDDVTRFKTAGQVSAALGLVPSEDSSAERRHRGHITKAGPPEVRSLLVQAAWACWRSHGSATLRAWVERLASRRGRRVAVVALARRLSRILFAIWRDETVFNTRVLAAA